MFKIQNFLNRTRFFLNKIQFPKSKSKAQSSFRTSITKFSNFIPSTCFFGINLLSMDRLKFETKSAIESNVETSTCKADKKDVKELIARIATEIREENLQNARTYINEGIQIAEQNNFTEYLPSLYDLLVTITLREGNNALAEEILVRSIEKLSEMGYKEADNEIVRFQLVLARLYQSKGDSEMAGLGFRNCLSVQETKFNADRDIDEATLSLYLSLLFWYSIFLSDENELIESKSYMKKALQLSKLTSKQSAQTLVILHYLAELSFRLKEFDDSIKYLVEGLRLCLQNLSFDCALPEFMVKLGLVYLVKGMNETAAYWCSIAQIFAQSSNNACVENEASLCLKYLKESKPNDS